MFSKISLEVSTRLYIVEIKQCVLIRIFLTFCIDLSLPKAHFVIQLAQ